MPLWTVATEEQELGAEVGLHVAEVEPVAPARMSELVGVADVAFTDTVTVVNLVVLRKSAKKPGARPNVF